MTNTEKSFLNEIIANHGVDSMQYVWAVNMINESVCKRARKNGGK